MLLLGLAPAIWAQSSSHPSIQAQASPGAGSPKPSPQAPGTAAAPPAPGKPSLLAAKDENSDKEKLFQVIKTVEELKQQVADLKALTAFLANQNKALEAKLKGTNQELFDLMGVYAKHTHVFTNGTYVGGWAGLPLFTQVIATPKDTPLKLGPPVHP